MEWSVILLEKDDFLVLPDNRLKIRHPAFQGRDGYVAFYTYHCPDCQDTKTSWSSIGMVRGPWHEPQGNPFAKDYMISRAKCIKRYPHVMYVRTDGIVQEYYGNVDKRMLVNVMCKKAGLCCDYVARCFSTDQYFQ